MTVVIVIAVGILAAFFYTIIWPSIAGNYNSNAKCNDAICECKEANNKCKMAICHLVDKNGNKKGNDFQCPWKG